MKIIIGLGNPGKKYENTRHNAGFLMLDKIKEAWDFPEFKFEKKFNAEISESHSKFKIQNSKFLLAKPQTFMNESGQAVKTILEFYKLSPEDLTVIHDDLDIELGKYKIATDSRSAGHNGVQNIIDNLGTQEFRRIRIGIGKSEEEKKECPIDGHPPRVDEASPRVEAGDYVLGKFSKDELEVFEKVLAEILEALC